MSLNNARRFVEKMREDQSFRNKALEKTRVSETRLCKPQVRKTYLPSCKPRA
jgi:hypothetical protein